MQGTTRERMLEATARLLHQRGYRGVNLNDILTESDAPRGSLYHHFHEGKDQLVQEAMLREVQRIDRFLLDGFHEAADPVEGALILARRRRDTAPLDALQEELVALLSDALSV